MALREPAFGVRQDPIIVRPPPNRKLAPRHGARLRRYGIGAAQHRQRQGHHAISWAEPPYRCPSTNRISEEGTSHEILKTTHGFREKPARRVLARRGPR